MFLDSFFIALINILQILINLYTWVIIINALISWVNPDPYNPIVQILHKLSSPAYRLLAKFPTRIGNIDLAPLIIILALQFLGILLTRLLGSFI